MGGIKKHKKHKSEKRDKGDTSNENKPPALKLILKVGSSSTTPEHSNASSIDWQGGQNLNQLGQNANISGQNLNNVQSAYGSMYSVQNDEESLQSLNTSSYFMAPTNSHHKKSKKKKKKKDKGKDRERKHRHHHKEKKRKRDESSQDEISFNEDSLQEPAIGADNPLNREPRLCVLRQRQERSSLQKLLEHLLKALEKRDPQNFFAWPVTDNIAPGYSHIISKPMDFSTMRQKIEENLYPSLQEFISDFRLMCTNAMEYNHMDTIYYKASKKLLHAGMKMMQPEKLGSWVLTHLPDLTSRELGFEIYQDVKTEIDMETEDIADSSNVNIPPLTKFEAIPDDLTPEEILAQCQAAAKEAKRKLSMKRLESKMGFLRQRKDGTTTLNILVGGDGVIPGTVNERPVSLGVLTGKLTEGSGTLQGFREDRRNVVKPVKPLYYGAFGSYAPSYDSTFANLSKEETELVYGTYGSDAAVQYAESILDFTKDCDYTLRLVDNLLDLLTGGEHSKTKKTLEEKKKLREEEETIKTLLEEKEMINNRIDLDGLKSLSDLGIDVAFLQNFEDQIKKEEESVNFQQKLQTTSQLLEKLQQVQNERLSLPLPAHLSNVPTASEQELSIVENITSNLTEMSKKVAPGDIINVNSLRKAMGITVPQENVDNMHLIEVQNVPATNIQQQQSQPQQVTASSCMLNAVTVPSITQETTSTEMPDLESELRQFLESQQGLNHSPLRDDKTIEEILME